MEYHIVKISSLKKITHDVLGIQTTKPVNYTFLPGQATEISINKPGWQEEQRPFTFTSLPEHDHLEFTIKTYPAHNGVTGELLRLVPGDELILHDVFGTIQYKGPGVFIAGGAGVTPFISIFRHLRNIDAVGKNKLIFANKTKADIILAQEFGELLSANFINVLSDEKSEGYEQGFLNATILKKYMDANDRFVYLCGPEPMMDAVEKELVKAGVNAVIVKEAF